LRCAAAVAKVDAIHPGYGFLSENADFIRAVEATGLIFIGPSAATVRMMGDKASAREAAKKAGVPVIPGSDGRISNMASAAICAKEIGYPVMIKAAAGGGGRGIRVVNDASELSVLAPQAMAEAKAAFGDDGVYIEKYIANARHIEVQILGDGRQCLHLYERECSLQRRRQKILEETPSVALSSTRREALCASAASLASSIRYRGAGTVEYLYDEDAQDFYFIEMNTRIQVEHPITESVTGVDIVVEMLNIAAGLPLSMSQNDIVVRGHAIEVRINAEDPANHFAPSPGTVKLFDFPQRENVRFDHMLYSGCDIPPFYDSLLGKMIAWGENRTDALRQLRNALVDLRIDGIHTTIPLFIRLLENEDVRAARYNTGWLESNFLRTYQ